ncbi:acyltransferase family protein [Sphaerisporangium sp. TRM90804]|uniref:acyltransferase family protein n=1 Tax=Sphaerisporangium sp. TRM90804 TaxID=3031113 RepID=UPI00244C5F3A|nr:acyltransferase family protein [Sphaerisporangium sp. TRM90804]MDH2426604.1 acyltransferase family protein [Sphaerisporangium sp. TRM90804]
MTSATPASPGSVPSPSAPRPPVPAAPPDVPRDVAPPQAPETAAPPRVAAPTDAAPAPRNAGTRATAPPKPIAPRSGERVRDPFLDNAKFLAITLVVTGHLIEDLRDVPAAHALYFFGYLFHMPLFILLSGYLSRNWTFSPGKARKLISGLAVPYAVFEAAYSLSRWLTTGTLEFSLLEPYYLTWFLMSLFMWRLSTPVWQQLRWPLAVAVGLSLLSGMSDLPDELSMNRTLGLLPFYVLGLMLRPADLEFLKGRWVRLAGAAVLAAGLALAFRFHADIATEWIRWRSSNTAIGVNDLAGSAIRLGLLTAGAALVLAFLAVTPSRRTWYSGLGAATMYAYLLHGFVVKAVEPYYGGLRTPAGVALVIVLGVGLTVLLCSPAVRRLTGWAVEPDTSWAFTKIRRPRSRPSR